MTTLVRERTFKGFTIQHAYSTLQYWRLIGNREKEKGSTWGVHDDYGFQCL